jgi:nucleoside-diphosphate-sugar epimerase
MEILVIGATGFVGGGVARHLVGAGHRVRGLARSVESARALQQARIDPIDGWDGVPAAAAQADAVVVAAQLPPEAEYGTVSALLDGFTGTFLFTSGSGVLLQRSGGAWSPDSFAEEDAFVVEPLATTRKAVEDLVRGSAARGVRAMVVRPGTIWGPGDHGHVSLVYRSVARTRSACYVGEGLNTYSHVHLADVARLHEAVLDRGVPGALYHATAGETPTRWIAERVAADLGVDTRSVTPAEAVEVWGEFEALIIGASSRLRDPRSRTELGWAPRHTDLLSTVGETRLRDLAAGRGAR